MYVIKGMDVSLGEKAGSIRILAFSCCLRERLEWPVVATAPGRSSRYRGDEVDFFCCRKEVEMAERVWRFERGLQLC